MKKSVAAVVTTLVCWLPITANNSLIFHRGLFATFYTLFAIMIAVAIYQICRRRESAPTTLRLMGGFSLLGFVPLTIMMLANFDANPVADLDVPMLRGHLVLVGVFGFLMLAFSHMASIQEHTQDHVEAH